MLNQWVVVLAMVLCGAACAQPEPKLEEESNQSEQADEGLVEERAQEVLSGLQVAEDEMSLRLQLPDVVERVMPSVVGIATEQTVQYRGQRRSPFDDHPMFREFEHFFGPPGRPQPRDRTRQGIGSGVIVDAAGVVLTNHHVIDQADTIQINLSDGRELTAEVIGTDPQSDIAVLQIQDPPDDLQPIAFGDSDALRLGESVIAIGNPFGLSGTVTLGIISAKGRANVGILDYENFIQTDAAINPGNSGGALIDLNGRLIGINTAIMSRSGGYQGVGFAIPSNMARMVKESLVADGTVDRGWLGVVIQDLTPELAEALGLEEGLEGVILSDVHPESPAAEAGLTRGDVVTEIAGARVRKSHELRNAVGLRSPGSEVSVKYVRDGQTHSIDLRLGSRNNIGAGAAPHEPESAVAAVEGLELKSLNAELRSQLRLPRAMEHGVYVSRVDPHSEAARLQLREGDVILEVNRRPVASVADFNAAYDRDQRRNLFLIFRDGATIFMTR